MPLQKCEDAYGDDGRAGSVRVVPQLDEEDLHGAEERIAAESVQAVGIGELQDRVLESSWTDDE